MKNKVTKSLIASILSLVLCLSMAVGTTFAWFTDSVTSGVNKIVAGNLDIEVSYKNDNTSGWTNLQSSETVFSKGFWEPGHTEFVTLKIENKGTLALNYKALVTPVSEIGGVNVYGDSFKLSDYLVFKTIDNGEDGPNEYTRDTARTAAGTTTGLTVSNLTQSGSLDSGKTTYITLVVYMPESVGNEANYMTGTKTPAIELGINVYATQKTKEADSFDDQYDADADDDYNATFEPSYEYYPQVQKTIDKAESGATTIKETGKIGTNNDATLVEVIVPAEAVDTSTSKLTVKVTPKDPESSTVSASGVKAEIDNANRDTANFDVKVEGIKTGNTEDIDVKLYVGTGLSNVKVYHNGTLIKGTTYDATSGIVSFKTKSFSDYTVAYDTEAFMKAAAAKVGANYYATFAEANSAAKAGDTVTVLTEEITLTGLKSNVTYQGTTFSNEKITNITNQISGTLDGIKIKNFKFVANNGLRYCYSGTNEVVIENCIFDTTTYGAHFDEIHGPVTFKNCTIVGFNTFASTSYPLTFDGCHFVDSTKNSYYVVQSWGTNVLFNKCDFSAKWCTVNDNQTIGLANGSGIVTFKECTVATGTMADACANGLATGYLVIDATGNSTDGYTAGTFVTTDATKISVAIGYKTTKVEGKNNLYTIEKMSNWGSNCATSYTTPVDETKKVVTISNAAELALFAKEVNVGQKSYFGYTVNLTDNIDLGGYMWSPIGQTGATTFKGVFDGKNKIISNMTIVNSDTGEYCSSGLFGWIESHGDDGEDIVVKNVVLEKAKVTGNHFVGAICGYLYGTITNCEVKDSVVVGLNANDAANGDKIGGIVGYACQSILTENKVSSCDISGNRDVGGIAGAIAEMTFTANNIENTTISYITDKDYASAGIFVSGRTGFTPDNSNTSSNVTVKKAE